MRKPGILLSMVMMVSLLMLVTAAPAQEKDKPLYPVGQISIEATQVAAGLGYSWGGGAMKFEGKEYQFTVKGLNVAAVGLAKIRAVGDVYNMKTAADFPGNYVAASAGLALAKGVSGTTMRNDKGVVINLRAEQQGVQLNLGVDGFTITMK
jgi:hypothetical protein